MPDWSEIFAADGRLLDAVDGTGAPGNNGVPDYQDLYGADDAVCVQDNLSDGLAIDMSVLDANGDVDNGTVDAGSDLGNAFVMAETDSGGDRILFAGVEYLDATNADQIEGQLLPRKSYCAPRGALANSR